VRRSVMRRCLKGLGGFPTSTDGFILGPSHGMLGRLDFVFCVARAPSPAKAVLHKPPQSGNSISILLNWIR
jgi:hypothetical protein